MLADLWYRLRSLLFSRRADAELDEELQFHLDREREKLETRGLDPADAQRRAAVAFGGISRTTEACRDARGVTFLTDITRDVRYGWRSLRRNPLFALTVVGSLALGIGANVTVFTLMRAALWRPLPLPHPEEIVHLRRGDPARSDARDTSLSYVLYQELREAAAPAARVTAKATPGRRKFGTDAESRERATVEPVAEDFFDVLGVVPAEGRLFTTGDDGPSGGRHVALLSHRFWTTRFNSDPGVLGQTIYVDEVPFEIVGVAAGGFDGVDAEQRVQVWIPLTADPRTTPAPPWLTSHHRYWLTLMARVAPGANVPALESALGSRFRAHLDQKLLPEVPPRIRAIFARDRLSLRPAAAGLATTGRRYESQLWVLAAIVSSIFLICCANVANVVRARNTRRRDEFALRRMLGASGGRLFRQLLVEGSILAAAGTVASLVAAPWLATGILSLLGTSEPFAFDLSPDRAIVALATMLGLAAALGASTFPAWRPTPRTTNAVHATRVTGRLVASRATVALQFGIVLVLLVVSGLCLSVLLRLRTVDLGFDADAVTAVRLSFPKATPEGRTAVVFEEVRQRLEQSGAIEAASYAFPDVYDLGGASMGIAPVRYTRAPGEDIEAGTISIGPHFFEVLRIPITEGHGFGPGDLQASSVVVNETFARRYFAGRTAIGEAVSIPATPKPRIATIVGVVADVRHYGVRAKPWPMVYQPGSSESAHLLVRARTAAPMAAIREAVDAVGAPAQIESTRPLVENVAAMISREQLLGVMSSSVATIGVLLAALGLYGIVAFAASARRHEFAVRLALGARRGDVQRLVLRETLITIAAGVIGGLAGAMIAARLLTRLVPDSPPLDWPLLSSAALVLVAVACLAAWIPAWRASLADPAVTLRSE
jgi:predicted permease